MYSLLHKNMYSHTRSLCHTHTRTQDIKDEVAAVEVGEIRLPEMAKLTKQSSHLCFFTIGRNWIPCHITSSPWRSFINHPRNFSFQLWWFNIGNCFTPHLRNFCWSNTQNIKNTKGILPTVSCCINQPKADSRINEENTQSWKGIQTLMTLVFFFFFPSRKHVQVLQLLHISMIKNSWDSTV